MLNLDVSIQSEGDSITVVPSDNIFAELGNNTYDYKDLLSELIDNSLAARIDGELLTVNISVGISQSNPHLNWLTISDDASGIPQDRLGLAITPAGIRTSGSLNEHGLGMKQAVAGLGELRYLATRIDGEEYARVIEGFHFGSIPTRRLETTWPRGTELAIHRLKAIVRSHPVSYSRDIVPHLGARYRRFLTPLNQRMQIIIQMLDIDDTDEKGYPRVIQKWTVEEIKPIYFHPNTRRNAPVVDHRKFKGLNWEAELVFGYSPDALEWEELGLSQPNRFHPYAVSLSRQGLDVILNDRVIMFHQLSELELVDARHNDYNSIRGEIVLKSGFTTAITKNSIIATEDWEQCLNLIKEFLDSNNYMKSKTYPDALPEAALRDRLANWLKNNDIAPRKDVKKEYPIEGLGGKIDVLADDEAWELKRNDAYGLDVYQLFGYLDMSNFKKGYLLAKGFKDSAYAARDHINKKHEVEIVLTPLESYPNQSCTHPEREGSIPVVQVTRFCET